MIDLEDKYLNEVKHILYKHEPTCEVHAFGSRVAGSARKYSDLDLVLVGGERIDWRRIEELKDAFSQSDLPIIIDVLDWHTIPKSFRKLIKKDSETIQEPDARLDRNHPGGEKGQRN